MATSPTDLLQSETAAAVASATAASRARAPSDGAPLLDRAAHAEFLFAVLEGRAHAPGYDATRVWLTYWALAGLDTLGALDAGARAAAARRAAAAFLATCQVPRGGWGGRGGAGAGGGFGGGPRQEAHAASTFAALAALTICARDGALACVDAAALARFYARLRARAGAAPPPPRGAFRVQADGEADVRGAYAVVAGAALAGLPLAAPLFRGTAAFAARALSHEGGAAGEAGGEAHGGYAYCALAALELLAGGGWAADGAPGALPGGGGGWAANGAPGALPGGAGTGGAALAPAPGAAPRAAGAAAAATLRWVARRQLPAEGGFSGRAHKVVDACYSFWVAAAAAVAGGAGRGARESAAAAAAWDARAAARYVLRAAQAPGGGLRDKPGKAPDAYHTCYALLGLALAQRAAAERGAPAGAPADALAPPHVLFGVRADRLAEGARFWAARAADAAPPRGVRGAAREEGEGEGGAGE